MDFWKKWNNVNKLRFPIWKVGVCIGVILLLLGVYYEQFTDIYRKAIMICLECIGIG